MSGEEISADLVLTSNKNIQTCCGEFCLQYNNTTLFNPAIVITVLRGQDTEKDNDYNTNSSFPYINFVSVNEKLTSQKSQGGTQF